LGSTVRFLVCSRWVDTSLHLVHTTTSPHTVLHTGHYTYTALQFGLPSRGYHCLYPFAFPHGYYTTLVHCHTFTVAFLGLHRLFTYRATVPTQFRGSPLPGYRFAHNWLVSPPPHLLLPFHVHSLPLSRSWFTRLVDVLFFHSSDICSHYLYRFGSPAFRLHTFPSTTRHLRLPHLVPHHVLVLYCTPVLLPYAHRAFVPLRTLLTHIGFQFFSQPHAVTGFTHHTHYTVLAGCYFTVATTGLWDTHTPFLCAHHYLPLASPCIYTPVLSHIRFTAALVLYGLHYARAHTFISLSWFVHARFLRSPLAWVPAHARFHTTPPGPLHALPLLLHCATCR